MLPLLHTQVCRLFFFFFKRIDCSYLTPPGACLSGSLEVAVDLNIHLFMCSFVGFVATNNDFSHLSGYYLDSSHR